MPLSGKSCSDCYYSIVNGHNSLRCHKYPPKLWHPLDSAPGENALQHSFVLLWPIVLPTDWCGDWDYSGEVQYQNITTVGTFVIKNGPGRLYRVIVNNLKITDENVNIYNGLNTSSPLIGTLSIIAKQLPFVVNYDIQFSTGLTIVTHFANDITVVYK